MLKSSISVDKYMNPDLVLETKRSIDKQVSQDIEHGKVSGNLERYKSKQEFNAIREIDR